MAAKGQSEEVAKLVLGRLKFDPQATEVPWKGGALFIPGIQWEKENAHQLVDNLIRWYVWCDRNSDNGSQQQIHNNIRGTGLARVVGYRSPGWRNTTTEQWLSVWGGVIGKEKLEALLKEQGAEDNASFQRVLNNL